METNEVFTLDKESTFLSERFGQNNGANNQAKSLFKKLPDQHKLFFMNNTNGSFASDFNEKYATIHEQNRADALDKLLKEYGFNPEKDYNPQVQAQEAKKAVTSAKSVDRWAKIVLINVIGAIFNIKLDAGRGFNGVKDDLKIYFASKKEVDERFFAGAGITDPEEINKMRQEGIMKAYSFFQTQFPVNTGHRSARYDALTSYIGSQYKNDYFDVSLSATGEEEWQLISLKIKTLIATSSHSLAIIGGDDEAEIALEVEEKLPEALHNLCQVICELL